MPARIDTIRGATAGILAAAALTLFSAPSFAQSGCPDKAEQATAPTPAGSADGSGTDPGATGSTGWTGGTGGSNIGTTPSGPAPGSQMEHPKTAQGVNPVPTPADPNSGPKPSC